MITVEYTYADGGNFSRKFSSVKQARALYIELLMARNIVWLMALRGDRKISLL